jgi:NADPH:quinone reductase
MKAVVFEQFGPIESGKIADLPRPEAGDTDVVIAVQAAPVNFVDLVVTSGKYQFAPALPFTPGKGPSGLVTQVGSLVRNIQIGDRVLGMAETGGYAEFARVPGADCFLLPAKMSFEEASSISLAYDTAWFALRERARLMAGDKVLVLGATGAVGRACMQLARAMGAFVIAAVSSPARAEAAIAAGADAVVDLSVDDLRDNFRKQVFALTNQQGADIIIDMLGGDPFDAAIRSIAWRGRVVIVGFASGRIPTVKLNYLMLKNMEISGLQVSDYRKRRPDLMADCFRDVFALFEQGKIDVGGSVVLPLSDFARAMHMVEDRSTLDRVILAPQPRS